MRILDTKKLYKNPRMKIPETKWNAGKEAIVKDIKRRFKINGLDISYLKKEKILKLHYMICDIEEFQSITMAEAIEKLSGILKPKENIK